MSRDKSLHRKLLAALVCAAAATAAHAQNPNAAIPNQWDVSHYTANNPVAVYISGSTAVDTTIINVMDGNGTNLGMCASYQATVDGATKTISTLSVYYNGTASAYTEKLMTCEANPTTTGLPNGTAIAVYKESNVGSANGIQPLIDIAEGQASGLNFFIGSGLEAANADTTCTSSAGDADGGGLNPGSSLILPYNQYVDCPATSQTETTAGTAEVTGGVADVEARMLQTAAGNPINATLAGTYLNSSAGLDVVWGVPVTKNLYYALQKAEGIVPSTACPANSTLANDGSAGNDSPACAPSLSKEQVASLYTGQIYSWSQLGITNPKGNENVYLCRRDKGSGTEGSFEAYFLGARCSQSVLAMLPEDADFVWANPSQGHILSCMEAFYSGGDTTSYYVTTGSPPAPVTVDQPGNQYAIGIASTEITPNQLSSVNDAVRFIAVDGVLPTLANTINGFWPYFSTDAWYTIKTTETGHDYPSAESVTLFGDIQHFIGHPTFTQANDSAFESALWGQGGDLAPAPLFASEITALPVNQTEALATPINAYTKAPSGSVDNCNTPVLDTADLPSTVSSPVETQILGTGTVNTTE